MTKKIFPATLLAVILLAVVFSDLFNSPSDKTIGPVLVPLYEHPQQVSFRGLHATDDSVVVVGGSDGVFGFSTDAGEQWVFQTLPQAAECQFRSVWAHNHKTFFGC